MLDFGTRTLVIGGTLRVPNGGTLSLTAGDIDVRRAISGRHAKPFSGAGADIALAARGSLTVRWRIDASARASAGSIHLLALQDIRLLAPIRAATNGPQPAASGGVITVSGGAVVVEVGAKMLVDGDVPGGSIDLDATAGDLTLSGDFRARGEAGGRIRGSASRSLRASGAFAAAGDGCIGLMAGASLDVTGAEFDVPLALTCP